MCNACYGRQTVQYPLEQKMFILVEIKSVFQSTVSAFTTNLEINEGNPCNNAPLKPFNYVLC